MEAKIVCNGREGAQIVAICTERVEAKIIDYQSAGFTESCNLHGACGGKASTYDVVAYCSRCNLHGACGGKDWRLPPLCKILIVAICTERVEAKFADDGRQIVKRVAICTERVEAKPVLSTLFIPKAVAICTERVEAKMVGVNSPVVFQVAICTERVEAKQLPFIGSSCTGRLQSARSVWRQRHVTRNVCLRPSGCNLHGACGGKVILVCLLTVKIGCNLHGACGGKEAKFDECLTIKGCNLHGACGGKVICI